MAAPKPATKADPRDRKIGELERANVDLGRRIERLEKWLNERDINLSAATVTIETLARVVVRHVDDRIDRNSEPIPF